MQGCRINFQESEYRVIKLLGKGKSAYSWLCESGGRKIVLKQIHDEPCSYYEFIDKFQSEITAYQKLKLLQIEVPRLLGTDPENRWIFKEYIHGKTASELIASNKLHEHFIEQLFFMAHRARSSSFNLDYFPNNFIIHDSKLFYIDYELNPYSDDWNLENWGLYYWINNVGMKKFLATGNAGFINEDPEKGIPIKAGFEIRIRQLIERYHTSEQ